MVLWKATATSSAQNSSINSLRELEHVNNYEHKMMILLLKDHDDDSEDFDPKELANIYRMDMEDNEDTNEDNGENNKDSENDENNKDDEDDENLLAITAFPDESRQLCGSWTILGQFVVPG
ncbi:hypothetical protein RhiirA4_548932 [Rhizophagus irregularis]|uniref:Uncharacterized protein n=1 Tax=Rhizophagus irregularis TaxID=588596 RepID=A0A2I1HAE2_9GLOM|nr:hypothetical protein RhiirA4_548932 [Rhizophagus irregularis]